MQEKFFKNYLLCIVRDSRLLLSNSLNYLISLLILPFLAKKNQVLLNRALFINTMKLGDLEISLKFLIQFQESNLFQEHYLLLDSRYIDLLKSLRINIRLIPWNRKSYKYNIFYRIKFIKILRRYSFLTAYNISQERGILNDELTLLSGANKKICFKKNAEYLFPFFNFINSRKYSTILNFDEMNEYKLLDLVSNQLGLKIIHSIDDRFIISTNNTLPSSYICIAPFSSDNQRNWSIVNYLTLVQELSIDFNIVLLGNKIDSLHNQFCENSHIFNLIGKTTLSELPGIIKNSQLFIGNDSGLTHLANVLEIPLIAIIGGGMYGRFFPHRLSINRKYRYYLLDCFGCEWYCIYKERYCLTKVTVATILSDVYKILN
ncbi:MAG: hypothetical protein M0Q21_01125 [Ignavibacteriaceae bacterium]|nr:hypothetical protein [Ignavibacteriaceae bacterium]